MTSAGRGDRGVALPDGRESMSQRTADERILVIAFKYPPFPYVGGRRWSALSDYIGRLGVRVDVVSVRWRFLRGAERSHPAGVRVYRTPSFGPHRLRWLPSTSAWTTRFRHRLKKLLGSHSWAEDAYLWLPVLAVVVPWLQLRHRYNAIVVTGAPFMANYWMSIVQRVLGNVPLIQEFQDPWSDLPALQTAPNRARQRVMRREQSFVERAAAVVTVTEGLSSMIAQRSGTVPVVTIPNGYDPAEYRAGAGRHSPVRPFRIVYAGALSGGRIEPLRAVLDAIVALASTHEAPEMLFLGRAFPAHIAKEYSGLVEAGLLSIRGQVSAEEVPQIVSSAFACLQLNARQYPYLVSTKIYEYGAARRPVLSVNYGGEIVDLVTSHGLGWSASGDDPDDILSALREMRTLWLRDPRLESAPTGLERFGYDAIAREYLDLIREVSGRQASLEGTPS